MSKTVLFELGLEELPARFIDDAEMQLVKNTEAWLKEQRIPYQSVKSYATPRRLAIQIFGVENKQPDVEEEAKGPAKKIALNDEGEWSKAAIGFSKGQGKNVEDIYFKEIKGTEYVHVKKFIKGKLTSELLQDFKDVLVGLNFPKNMRWGDFNLRYVRPIRWIIALYEDEVIPFQIENVKTNNETYGHRFLGGKTTIAEAASYESVLKAEYVLADKSERKTEIEKQLKQMEEDKDWTILIDEDLLNEVTHLVEYPTVFSGAFSEDFLEVPDEVLITSMKEHQRYFPVQSNDGKLLPYFVAVRNGNAQHIEKVSKGNEKVLKARLADAQFFYQEDQKGSIDEKLQKLNRMVYQVELGTLADKVDRVKTITAHICNELDSQSDLKKKAIRTAEISKFDLVTHMVDEFTELQGVMGEKYAKLFGEDEEVATAINEHYMPRQANGQLPQTEIGSIVSIADKLDTIIGSIAIGNMPTGSQDPYGLRRQSLGILQILKTQNWQIQVESLLNSVIDLYVERDLLTKDKDELVKEVHEFFRTRASFLFKDEGIAPDIVKAVLSNGIQQYSITLKKAELLSEKRNDSNFKPVHEALGRVLNLAKKTEEDTITTDLFQNSSEANLFKTYEKIHELYIRDLKSGNLEKALEQLGELTQPIHSFFDQTMVMAEDQKVRANRLALLKNIAHDILQFADLNEVEWKQQY
ncbi:glycine--tRNA ligase beta subunit [Halobacillus andaensis]|uniref:Glycine--tRNA ligase beta subunit n=1 Tax=Halobacillus andaensis TaxID=1176239 RepID=A0A917EUM2_HALAA|nr:glycine--tRNA ligase subunit beta [Halobacillus andaensis]MBP2003059.1 glycyl-tRNA synthetase beta chain [Halobacillus andaensis]GGF07714.1 glycine--tRNA ligase beta subunit [Halobacillus andaensis]